MRGAKIDVDWERRIPTQDGRLNKFRLFLQEKGIRDSTIEAGLFYISSHIDQSVVIFFLLPIPDVVVSPVEPKIRVIRSLSRA